MAENTASASSNPASHPSRRTILGGGLLGIAAVGGAALGFTSKVHHKVAVPPPVPPTALTVALATQDGLLADYDSAISAGGPRTSLLQALKGDLTEHRDAVLAVLELYPGWRYRHDSGDAAASGTGGAGPGSSSSGSTPPPSPSGVTLSTVRQAAAAAAAQFRHACLAWPTASDNAARVVPLFASIGACLATHEAVLA